VTALLRDAPQDAQDVLDQLVPLIYDELRGMAHRQLGARNAAHTLNTTALVHEAYLRLVDQTQVTARGRAYFFAAAAHAMRHVLVDRARRRTAQKRGGDQAPLYLDETDVAIDTFAGELLDLDQALDQLAARNARQAQVVECRFFGGLSIQETADALDVSPRTVQTDWTVARAWLNHRLHQNLDP
jgi:RNA polymerase sigma factor (TIGR02999 family)